MQRNGKVAQGRSEARGAGRACSAARTALDSLVVGVGDVRVDICGGLVEVKGQDAAWLAREGGIGNDLLPLSAAPSAPDEPPAHLDDVALHECWDSASWGLGRPCRSRKLARLRGFRGGVALDLFEDNPNIARDSCCTSRALRLATDDGLCSSVHATLVGRVPSIALRLSPVASR